MAMTDLRYPIYRRPFMVLIVTKHHLNPHLSSPRARSCLPVAGGRQGEEVERQ